MAEKGYGMRLWRLVTATVAVVCVCGPALAQAVAAEDAGWGLGIIATTALRRAAVMGAALVLALAILWLAGRRKRRDG